MEGGLALSISVQDVCTIFHQSSNNALSSPTARQVQGAFSVRVARVRTAAHQKERPHHVPIVLLASFKEGPVGRGIRCGSAFRVRDARAQRILHLLQGEQLQVLLTAPCTVVGGTHAVLTKAVARGVIRPVGVLQHAGRCCRPISWLWQPSAA
eukprot:scaffold5382_cov405-Prasinococcus_capsulatus_cf.AAC.8